MRLSDLLGCAVVGPGGEPVGHVIDAVLQRSGPELEGFGASYVVAGLRVERRRRGNLFGYDRADAGGPALVRWVLRSLHTEDSVVDWDEVASVDGDGRVIRLRQP